MTPCALIIERMFFMAQSLRHPAKRICTGALLLAMGILLPQVFHMIGGPAAGGMFLPMHIPVLLAGLLLGAPYGALLGVITPLLSFMATGMPAAAKLPFMLLELTAYGALAGLPLSSKPYGFYLNLLIAQIGGRVVNALALVVAAHVLHLNVPAAATVLTALVTGLPGVAIQWIFLPILALLLKRGLGFEQPA